MASAYVESRQGARGRRHRAVLAWKVKGAPKRKKGPWTRYWKKAHKLSQQYLTDFDDVRLGIKPSGEIHFLSELIAEFFKARNKLRPKTKETDAAMVSLVKKAWGDPALHEITKGKVVQLREKLREKRSEGTVGIRLRSLKTMLYYAIEELGWLDKHPMIGVSVPESGDRERIYSDDEFNAMLDLAEPDLKCPLILARYRGMRRGEILLLGEDGSKKLLLKDSDGDYWIRLRKPSRFGIKSDRNLKTKRKGERDVHIPPEAVPYMDLEGTEGPVLKNLTTHRLRLMWERLRVKAGVKGRWHDWKHTSVTRLLEEGASKDDVLNLTGNTPESLEKYDHALRRTSKAVLSRTALPKLLPKKEKEAGGKGGKSGISDDKKDSGYSGSNREPPAPKAAQEPLSPVGESTKSCCPLCGQSVPHSPIKEG